MIKKFEDYIKEGYYPNDFDAILYRLKDAGWGDHVIYSQEDFEDSSYYTDDIQSDEDYFQAFFKYLEDKQMGQNRDDEYCEECGELITNDPNVARQCECGFNESKIGRAHV